MESIRDALAETAGTGDRRLWGIAADARLDGIRSVSHLHPDARALDGRSVLVATRDQFTAALALIELDGVARRIVLCTPDVASDGLQALAARAGADAIVTDDEHDARNVDVPVRVRCTPVPTPIGCAQPPRRATEWVLLTSGTTAAAKMVRHDIHTLTGAIAPAVGAPFPIVWGTFYDIRRYGGLQILLRALFGGGSFVVGGPGEATGSYLDRLGAHGATHISGTPSHWRRVLMSTNADAIAPRYIRLSGEIADQAILDSLRARYPGARIAHAFASTEAGVGFDVNDGLAGFPASLVGAPGHVRISVDGGSLRLQSARTSRGYLDDTAAPIADDDGFVDTGDMVERRGDRYYFLGRRSGVINIGGLKVYPEEVEAAINRHPSVRLSRVRAQRNPIVGSLVAADVVLDRDADGTECTREILQNCRAVLPRHMIPATVRIVAALEIAAAGKLARHA
jgi:acyl-CoA synthetase (AMP-forming)/AMP-acid ligase II